MTEWVKWAVVGAGKIAATFAQDMRFAEGAELVAVCSRQAAKAAAFAERHGIAGHFAGLDDLLAQGGVDAVYLATPNSAHFESAARIIGARLPLLIEKPMTVHAGEAAELAGLAEKHKTFLMEALWTRYLPAHVKAKAAIEAGTIGTITGFSADVAFQQVFDPKSRVFARDLGGGALLDLGIYALSMAEFYLGPADAVDGCWTAAPTGVDMSAALTYRKGPVTARLTCGFDRDGTNLCVIEGTDGTLVFAPPFIGARGYFLVRNALSKRLLTADSSLVRKSAARLSLLPGTTWHDCRPSGSGLEYEITAASAAIRQGLLQEPAMPLSSTIAALRWIEEVLASPPSGTGPG